MHHRVRGRPPRPCPSCLDVRENDAGDRVVTKGDKYDVREKDDEAPTPGAAGAEGGAPPLRGGPCATSACPSNSARATTARARTKSRCSTSRHSARRPGLEGLPLLAVTVLDAASASVFVPLTVSGGGHWLQAACTPPLAHRPRHPRLH